MKIKKTTTTISYHHRSFVLKSKRPKQKYSLSLSSPQQCERQKARRQKTRQKRGCKNQKKRERRERSIFFQPMESGRFCISLSLSLLLSFSFSSSSSSEEETTETHRFFSPHRPSLDARFSLSLSFSTNFPLLVPGREEHFHRNEGRERNPRERKKKRKQIYFCLP